MATLEDHGRVLVSQFKDILPKTIHVEIADPYHDLVFEGEAELRQFSTGSWGWMIAGKAPCPGAEVYKVQVNVQLVVIGSKPGSDKGPKP